MKPSRFTGRSLLIPGALLIAGALLSGCGAGVAGIIVLLTGSRGGSGGGAPAGAPPVLSFVPPLAPGPGFYTGDVELELRLEDPEGDPVHLEVSFFHSAGGGRRVEAPATAVISRWDGERWLPAGGALAAPAGGARYRLTWRSGEDVRPGGPGDGVLPGGSWGLVLALLEAKRTHEQAFSLPLDNAPAPEVEIVSLRGESADWRDGDSYFGAVEVEYGVRSAVAAEVALKLQAFLGVTEPQDIGDEAFLQADGEPRRGRVRWDTGRIPHQDQARLELRASRVVEGRRTREVSAVKGPFAIENQAPRIEVLAPLAGDRTAGDVMLDFILSHPQERRFDLEVLFTDDLLPDEGDFDERWLEEAREATPVAAVPEEALAAEASPGGSFHRFIWSSFRDTHDGKVWPAHVPYASARTMLHLRARNARNGLPGPWVHTGVFALDQRWMTTVAGRDPAGDGGDALRARFLAPRRVAFGPEGSIYIADGNRIRRVTPQGLIFIVAGTGNSAFDGDGSPAVEGQLNGPSGMAVAQDGSIYIADLFNHRVRRVSPQGIIDTVAGNGRGGYFGDGVPATTTGLKEPSGVALGLDGSLYIADRENHRVRRVSPEGIITTVAGTGAAGLAGDGGPAVAAKLNRPLDVALGPQGTLYISDTTNGRIRAVSPSGTISTLARFAEPNGLAVGRDGPVYVSEPTSHRVFQVSPQGEVSVLAGNGSLGGSGDGGPATAATLDQPRGVAVGGDGSVYIAATYNFRIRRVSPQGTIDTVAGTGEPSHSGYGGDGGPATEANLFYPSGTAIALDGTVYLCDMSNARVRKITPHGVISTIAGSGYAGPPGEDRLDTPAGLDVDRSGTVYIADTLNHRIRRVLPDGTGTTVAGNGIGGYGGDGGPATQASLWEPSAVALGLDGSLTIADTRNNRIRRVLPDGTIVRIAGKGGAGYAGDGGPATQAGIYNPYGVALGPDGSVYIADSGNNRIRLISPQGTISTIAGTGEFGDGGDGGPAIEALLKQPNGVAVAPDGSIYIADLFNHRIRRVSPDGRIATVTGIGVPGFGGDRGPAELAALDFPTAVALGPDGAVYITDKENNRVRRFYPPP